MWIITKTKIKYSIYELNKFTFVVHIYRKNIFGKWKYKETRTYGNCPSVEKVVEMYENDSKK